MYEYQVGYNLYLARRPITWCDNIAQARGWLAAEYGEAAAIAAEYGVECNLYPPSRYTDAEILGIIAQAEDVIERHSAMWRMRGAQ